MNDPESYVIREARNADRVKIGALWSELMRFHRALDSRFTLAPDAEQKYVRHLQDLIRSRDARVLIAEESGAGEPVGFLVGEIQVRPPIANPGTYGFISDIYVREAWRRSGVGRALFEEMRRWFVARNVKAVELYVAQANPTAIGFWESAGFTPFLTLVHLDL